MKKFAKVAVVAALVGTMFTTAAVTFSAPTASAGTGRVMDGLRWL